MNDLLLQQYLAQLNEEQRKVVDVGPGLCVVPGSPGTGKSTCIVGRIGRLIRDGLPGRYILATTFMRSAAKELNERLQALGINDCRIGTLHSVCWEFLQLEDEAVRELSLRVDEGIQLELELKKIIYQLQQRKRLPSSGIDLSEVESYVSHCKATGCCYIYGNPFSVNRESEQRQLEIAEKRAARVGKGVTAGALFEIYCELELKRGTLRLITYDDMILWTWLHLSTDPAALARWRNKWAAIISDEAQDQIPLQWDLSMILAGFPSVVEGVGPRAEPLPPDELAQRSLLIAGNVGQSLFLWRSADPAIFIDLCTRPDTGMLELTLNYRSVPEICQVAEEFARGEDWAIPGAIVPANPEPEGGAKQSAFSFTKYGHGLQEAAAIAQQIRKLIEGGSKLSEIAVLSRLSFFLNLVEIELVRHGISYIKRCSGNFIDSKEAQGVLAYLRVATGYDPDGAALKKTVLCPFKYISKDELSSAAQTVMSSQGKVNLLEALLRMKLTGKKMKSLYQLRDLLVDLTRSVNVGIPTQVLLNETIDRTDYIDYIRREDGSAVPDASRTAVLEEVVELSKLFPQAAQFLAFCDQLKGSLKLGRSNYKVDDKEGQQRDAVILSTIHRGKGLGFESVFIADVVQGRFPWNRAVSMGEELRLMYTAVTRAKKRCAISWSMTGEDSVRSTILDRLEVAYEKVQKLRNPKPKPQPQQKLEEAKP